MPYFYFLLDMYLFAVMYSKGERSLGILFFCAAVVQGVVIVRRVKK